MHLPKASQRVNFGRLLIREGGPGPALAVAAPL